MGSGHTIRGRSTRRRSSPKRFPGASSRDSSSIPRTPRRIRQYLTKEDRAITEESTLKEDLGLDSFDIMNILIECEDAFDVRISDMVLGNFITVRDIERALRMRRGDGGERRLK